MAKVTKEMERTTPEDPTRRFKKESIHGGPVTCVSLLSDTFCWVARGSFLELAPIVYEGPRKTRWHLVFPDGGTIHGAKHGESKINVVFGGRQLAILHGGRGVDEPLISAGIAPRKGPVSDCMTVSDWVWDLRMIVNDCNDGAKGTNLILALGLANNACDVWMLHRPTHELIYEANRQRRIIGMSRSIIYSMCFFGWKDTLGDLILASGTVTNEILVWTAVASADLPSEQNDAVSCTTGRQPEMHILRGHEGVIHSVKFHPESGDYLASTSDDRSVRLWERTNVDGWSLKWNGWAHTARVWCVAFSPVGLVSCGEDATAKIWDLSSGSLLGEMHLHNNQCLWSIDVRDTLALIGCNNGSAKLWDLRCRIVRKIDSEDFLQRAEHENTMSTFHVPDDRRPTNPIEQAPCMSPSPAKDNVDKISYPLAENIINPDNKKSKVKVKSQTIFGIQFYHDEHNHRKLLVPTRTGSLFSLSLVSGTWEELMPWCVSSSNISSDEGSCVAVHVTGSLAAIGTTSGDILLVALSPRDDAACDPNPSDIRRRVCQGRSYFSIKHIAWLDNGILSFHIRGIILLWNFSSLAGDGFFDASDNAPPCILNTTEAEVPTCFARRIIDNFLFVGDSRGNIATFLLDNASHDHETVPATLARRVHKKEHVTEIMCLQNGRIISVGNDGCIRYSLINNYGEFETILSVPLSTLPGLNHIYLKEQMNGEETIVVAGYRGNTFLALDVSSGYELFRVDTGGRQRAHTCFVDLNNSSHFFPAAYGIAIGVSRRDGRNEILLQSFVSKSSENEEDLTKVNVDYSVGPSLHSEPIFDLCMFTTRPGADYSALLSGSEDCTARVSIVRHSTIIHSSLLSPQSSCIRAVCSSRRCCGNTTLLVVCGGKMAVHFYALTDSNGNTQSSVKSTAETAVMDGIVIRFMGTGYFPSKPSIDHRVNAVHAVPSETCENASHFVVTGDSNGCIYLFTVSTEKAKHAFSGQLLCSLSRPVLSIEVRFFPACAHLFIAAGTTDGRICMWLLPTKDFTLPISPLREYRAHQMGTNSISTYIAEEGKNRIGLIIYSGGDDQSISISFIEVLLHQETNISSPSLNIASFTRIDVASASGIKGVRHSDATHVVSVGYSQRLAYWELSPDMSSLRLLSTSTVDVADVNCFSLSRSDNLLVVGGAGIAFASISNW